MKIPLDQHFKDIEELSKKIKMLDNSKEQAALLKDLKIIKKRKFIYILWLYSIICGLYYFHNRLYYFHNLYII